jgi:hypothetical protein
MELPREQRKVMGLADWAAFVGQSAEELSKIGALGHLERWNNGTAEPTPIGGE